MEVTCPMESRNVGLFPGHLQLVRNPLNPMDLTQRFLRHLFLIVGLDGSAQDDILIDDFKPYLATSQIGISRKNEVNSIAQIVRIMNFVFD